MFVSTESPSSSSASSIIGFPKPTRKNTIRCPLSTDHYNLCNNNLIQNVSNGGSIRVPAARAYAVGTCSRQGPPLESASTTASFSSSSSSSSSSSDRCKPQFVVSLCAALGLNPDAPVLTRIVPSSPPMLSSPRYSQGTSVAKAGSMASPRNRTMYHSESSDYSQYQDFPFVSIAAEEGVDYYGVPTNSSGNMNLHALIAQICARCSPEVLAGALIESGDRTYEE